MVYSKKELDYLVSDITLLNKEVIESKGEVLVWLNIYQIGFNKSDVFNSLSDEALNYALPLLVEEINENNLIPILSHYYKKQNGKVEMTCSEINSLQYYFSRKNQVKLNNFLINAIKSDEIVLILDMNFRDFMDLNEGMEDKLKECLKNGNYENKKYLQALDLIINNKDISKQEDFIKVIKLIFDNHTAASESYTDVKKSWLDGMGVKSDLSYDDTEWLREIWFVPDSMINKKDIMNYIINKNLFDNHPKLAIELISKINILKKEHTYDSDIKSRKTKKNNYLSLKNIKFFFKLNKEDIGEVVLQNYRVYLNNENEKQLNKLFDLNRSDIVKMLDESIKKEVKFSNSNIQIIKILALESFLAESVMTDEFIDDFLKNSNNKPYSKIYNGFFDEGKLETTLILFNKLNNSIKKDLNNNNLSINKSITYLLIVRDFLYEYYMSNNLEDDNTLKNSLNELMDIANEIKIYLGNDFSLLKQYIPHIKTRFNEVSDLNIIEKRNYFNNEFSFDSSGNNDYAYANINGIEVTLENYNENKKLLLNMLKKIKEFNLEPPINLVKFLSDISCMSDSDFFKDMVDNNLDIKIDYLESLNSFVNNNFIKEYDVGAIDYLNKGKLLLTGLAVEEYNEKMCKILNCLNPEDRVLLLDSNIKESTFKNFKNNLQHLPSFLNTRVDYIPFELEMEFLTQIEADKDFKSLAMWILSLNEKKLKSNSKIIYKEKIELLLQNSEIRDNLHSFYNKFLFNNMSNRGSDFEDNDDNKIYKYLSKEKLDIYNSFMKSNNYETTLLLDYCTDKYNLKKETLTNLIKQRPLVDIDEGITFKNLKLVEQYIKSIDDCKAVITNISNSKPESLKLYEYLSNFDYAKFNNKFLQEVLSSDTSNIIKLFVNEKTDVKINIDLKKSILNDLKLDKNYSKMVDKNIKNILFLVLGEDSINNEIILRDYCIKDDDIINLLNNLSEYHPFRDKIDLVFKKWFEKDSYEQLSTTFEKLVEKDCGSLLTSVINIYKSNYLTTNPEFLVKLENYNIKENRGFFNSIKNIKNNTTIQIWMEDNSDMELYFEKYAISLNVVDGEKKKAKKIKF